MTKQTIGVIGGMGPMATADLFRKMILRTDAESDAGHAHIIIDNVPSIPNRTEAILYGGPSPLPMLTESAMRLKNAGADFFILPCNTSHFWFDELCRASGLDGLSMVEAAADELVRRGVGCCGILATDGTVKSGIYKSALEKRGIRAVNPSEAGQREVMRLIYDCVKAGREPDSLDAFAEELRDMRRGGAEVFLAACTELPLVFDTYLPGEKVVDATDILAAAALRRAGYAVRLT